MIAQPASRVSAALGRDRPWLLYLALCCAAAAAFLLLLALDPGTAWHPARSLALNAILASAPVAVLAGIRRYRPGHPAGWYLAAIALALNAAAHLAWGVLVLYLGVPGARVVAELGYLASYPVGLAALVVLLGRRSPGQDRAGILDAVTIGVGLALLCWPFLVEPFLRQPGLPPATRVHGVIAPLFDIAMLVLLLRLAERRRVVALRLILGGLMVTLASDALLALRRLPYVDDAPGPLELGWAACAAMVGVAALHPSMAFVEERSIPPRARLTRGRIAALLGLALAGPTMMVVLGASGRPVNAPMTLVGSVLMFTLVLTRMSGLAGEERARGQLQESVLARIVEATEAERNRIAADLHDGPIQRLAQVSITAAVIRSRYQRGDAAAGNRLLSALERQVGEEIETLRQLMVELRPPALDEWGLAAALDQCARDFTRRTGTVCTAMAEQAPLDPNRETVVYRVVQEALNNVAKHAQARRVEIRLGVEGETARLEIRDDGVGFEVDAAARAGREQRRFGVVSMRQRVATAGGTFAIRSKPGRGATITVHLPLPSASAS